VLDLPYARTLQKWQGRLPHAAAPLLPSLCADSSTHPFLPATLSTTFSTTEPPCLT
jgi:hypothetical protein